MGFSKLALALAIVSAIYVSTAHLAQAQDNQQEYLRPHNAARAAVRVGPLKWNRTLENFARRYAMQHVRDCRNVPPPGSRYGSNIYIGRVTASAAVASWVSEKRNYRCPSNTCAAGKTCSHYTQVVWKASTQLGCARIRCKNGNYFIICVYFPPGNRPGQRPYPCTREEAMEAAEGAMEELVEVAVEETMEMAEEEGVDVVEDVVAQVV
ncbi:pathogenesis-related protein PRB1-3-like [Phoenix dactylifera]|uniref:Pathogenesis-related protein PRB1-3-like n=1 Tax=Phoenix dactylifera TaxID=42345 RepID=A0A8B7CGS0_PHODC|nr:pathogenesis-related protein PRB1-3-like [Phoenix dactylifera]